MEVMRARGAVRSREAGCACMTGGSGAGGEHAPTVTVTGTAAERISPGFVAFSEPEAVSVTLTVPSGPVVAPATAAPPTGSTVPVGSTRTTRTGTGQPALAVAGTPWRTSGLGAVPVSGTGASRSSSPARGTSSQRPKLAGTSLRNTDQKAPDPKAWVSPRMVLTL